MKAAPFTLHTPGTTEDAVRLLAETGEEGGLVLAGGQSLGPMLALRVAYPTDLIDINGIEELGRLEVVDNALVIGATVRHARFHGLTEPAPTAALLARVVRDIAHYPIRQRGTFCGSIAHADPSSEWCLVAVTLGAEVRLLSATGERVVPVDAFIEGGMMTTRAPEELLRAVHLPCLPEGAQFGFYEFNRRAGDFALGMALACYTVADGVIADARVGIGGIEDKPRRLSEVEEALNGKAPTAETFAAAAALVTDLVEPMDDAATPATYRRSISAVVVRRALEASIAKSTET